MSRTRLLARRGAAHGGLLLLLLVLVAAMAAALGTTVGSVRAAEREIARESLSSQGGPASLVVQTRLRADATEQQDAALRDAVRRTFAVPLHVDRAVVADEGSDDPFVRWTLAPDVGAAAPQDLGSLASSAERLLPVLRDDDVATERGVVVTGDLGARAATAAEAVRAAAAVTLVPLLLLALVGVVVLAQVARLLAATRETEVRLLAARGASGAQVAGAAALEAVLLGAVGAALGAGAATAWLALRGVRSPGAADVVAPAAAVAVTAAVVLAVVAGLQGRRAVAGRGTEGAGRGRRAAAVGTVVVAVAAAAVTLWMLRRHGSPLVPTPDGGQPDPVAAAAPALALVAVAALALAVLGPLTRGWARLSARGRGAVGVLVARQVARRLVGAAVPVVLLVLAGGSAVLAGAYAGTAQRMQADAAVLAHGTDVRVVAPEQAARPDVAGAEAVAAPALATEGSVDGAPVALVALPAAAAADVVRAPAGTVDPAVLADALAGDDPFGAAPTVPGAPDALVVTVSARVGVSGPTGPGELPGSAAGAGPATWRELLAHAGASDRVRSALDRLESSGVRLWLWLADADGRLARVEAGTLDYDLDGDGDGAHPVGPAERRHDLVLDVPDRLRDGDLRLVGLDVLAAGSDAWNTRVSVAVDAVAPRGGAEGSAADTADSAWAPAGPETGTVAVPGDGPAGLGAVLVPAGRETTPYRILARGAGQAPARAVVTTSLADRLDLRVGDRVELPVDRAPLPVEVTGVVPAVPGAGRPDAALVDLAGAGAALAAGVASPPQPDETWIGTEPGGAATVARAVRAQAPADGTVTVTTTADAAPAVDAAAPVLAAFGVTAVGTALLAVVGLLAVASAALRSRRPEAAVLRAVGVPPRTQGRLRAAELAWVSAVAVLIGVAAGAGVAALTVPGLAGASLVGTGVEPARVLTLAARDAAVPLVILLLGVVVVLAVTRARVVAQARDGAYREEVR